MTRTIPCKLASLAFAAFFLLGLPAFAENARTLLNKGNALFTSGDYEAAYEIYKQGYEKSPSPVFLRSMAFSLLKLFQHQKARELLQEYLKKHPQEKDTKKIKDIINGLEVVVQTQVEVNSTPPGADIFFDTEASGKVGKTPYKATIEPGKHTVILTKQGYYLTTQTFDIQARQSLKLGVPLEVPLKVSSSPSGAQVFVNSVDSPSLGVTPLEGGIVPGQHKILVSSPGYKTFETTVTAAQGSTATVEARLNLGLKVTSVPPGAKVLLDGQEVVGSTPLEVAAAPGKHTITIQLPNYKPFSQEVLVEPGRDAAVDGTLSGGLLTMRTKNASGAVVEVSGSQLGQTPVEQATVPLGEHKVTLRHPDKTTWERSFAFSGEEVLTAEVAMAGPRWPIWTSAGVTLAGIVMGTVGAVLAKSNVDDEQAAAAETGYSGCLADGDDDGCSYGMHHMSTVGFTTAGVAAAAGLIYYWFWGRDDVTIERLPATRTASAR